MRLDEFYNPENDDFDKRSINDTRKARLTLEQLNKLRKYRDMKHAEQTDFEKFARVMYAQPAADAGGGL